MENPSSYINECIKKAVGTEECSIELEGSTKKGEGYMGDVVFVKVTLNQPNTIKPELHLMTKVGKTIPNMQGFISFVFKKEMFFYDQIVPILYDFQKDKTVKEPLDAFAKCHKTFVKDSIHVIVLDNMKAKGYEMLPQNIPLNVEHIRFVLRNYAKFHAISLALRDQRKEIFDKVDKTVDPFEVSRRLKEFKDVYDKASTEVIQELNEAGRKDLADKYGTLKERGLLKVLTDCYEDTPKEKVIVHGDSHIANMLFKYENGIKDPVKMVFVDFQLCGFHSPMTDISSFLYMVSSKEELSHFTELMEYYHKELSLFLSELGSDINKLYPISTMWEHWKKYSFFGFIQASGFLKLFYAGTPPDSSDIVNNVDKFFSNMNMKCRSTYLERLIAIIEHHFKFI